MFFTKDFSLIEFLQNLCSKASLVLLPVETCPVWDPISNAFTVTEMCVLSDSKWLYLFSFNVFAVATLCSAGQVSSKMATAFFFLF